MDSAPTPRAKPPSIVRCARGGWSAPTTGSSVSRSATPSVPISHADFDAEEAAELFPKWLAAGVIHEQHMEVDDLGLAIAEFVAMLLAHPGLTVPELTIKPPGPMMALDNAALAGMLESTVGTTS